MTFSGEYFLNNKAGKSTSINISSGVSRNYDKPSYGVSALNIAGYPSFSPHIVSSGISTTTFINNNNTILSNSSTSYFSSYANYIIINNGSSNWNLTLPLGPSTVSTTSPWSNSGFELYIIKTGSGTLTLSTPDDTVGTRVRGINTTSNKSFILSSSNRQVIKLLYSYNIDSDGNTDTTSEIWHIIQNSILNPSNQNGSLLFTGTTSSYLTIANDEDLRFGTGDFTIEWWQYQTDSNANPRIFSMGTYPSASIGVSIEGGTFYFWINGSPNSLGSAVTYKNIYTHFAIARSGSTIKVFKNGVQLGSNITSSYNFNDSTNDLRIGNEQTISSSSSFGGNIKGFHWVKGTALYSTTFKPNYNSITPHAHSKLLLNVADSSNLVTDSSGLNKTVTNTGVTFSTITHPFY